MPQSHSAGKPGRVLLFDELRGLSILLVVIYHGAFDLIAVYGVRIPIFDAPLLQKFLQPLFAGLFVFISGAVSRYSRSNLRRGLACFACGLLITLVTGLLPMVPDRFGILHLLGASMVLFALLRPLLDRIPRGKTHPVAVEHRDVEEKFIGQVVVRRVGEPADGHVLVDFFDRRFRFGGLHKGTGAFDGGVLPGPLRTAARQAEEQRAEERDGSFQGGSLPSGRFGTF